MISFRPIEKQDYSNLEKIISETWNYEQFCGKKTARKMAKLYLAGCLAEQDFTCVALKDGRAAGIIMGKDLRKRHKTKLKYRLRFLSALFSMALSADGRKTLKMYGGIDKIDRDLLNGTNQAFDGELSFFVLDRRLRGSGTGKELFNRFMDYAAKNNMESFFLYTDSTCSFGFYEHRGLIRRGEKSFPVPGYEEHMRFFIYSGECGNEEKAFL